MLTTSSSGVVIYRRRPDIDAIDEYSRRLTDSLRAIGHPTSYVSHGLSALLSGPHRPSWALLQYNPFSYGRWGFAPDLLGDALRFRRRVGIPLAIMVHEAWVPVHAPKSAVMGSWQRLQLRGLLQLADVVLTSTEALARELGHGAVHVPIASNVTPAPTTPEAARSELGLGPNLVVATFGRRHPSRALDSAAAAIAAIVASRGRQPTTVLNLGADAPPLALAEAIDVRTPGPLRERELSLHLWASDMLLLPFTDGISTRRGTLMAAMAHGRPVLGTSGANTDAVLQRHDQALTLTAAGDVDAFARAAVALAGDPVRQLIAGEASRRLYEQEFDWPHLATRVAAVLEPILPARGPAPELAVK